jgi:hypothetical protein
MSLRKFVNGFSLFDGIALFVGVLGSLSAAAISIDSFLPAWVLGTSIGVTVVVVYLLVEQKAQSQKNDFRKLREIYIATVVAVLAIVFRFGPFTFLQGGQDQGLYVNMASTLHKWGSVRFPDSFRASLDQTAQQMYDQTQLASISVVDSFQSTMTIEFYPLHPALMAICRFIFGGYGHQSLILMSLLGVVAAWYLAIEVDGRKPVAFLFSLFVAINPALTFFSKFPVSETIALTYVLIGMIYFLRYLRLEEVKGRRLSLLISLLSFNCLFYVRWQFILYVPFFVALILWNFLRQSGFKNQRQLFQFVGLVFVLFALSMFYYMKKQPELYTPVRDSILDMLPSVPNTSALLVGVTCLAFLLFAAFRIPIQRRTRFAEMIEKLVPFLLPAVLLLSIPSIISLYQGVSMAPWGYRVPSDVDGWVIRYHYIYRLALFTSPWLLLVAVVTHLFRPVRNRNTAGLFLFVSICIAGVQLRPYVPYLYYYGRYLIVDVLPAILLLGAISLVEIWNRRRVVAAICGVATVSYFLLFSIVLVGKREGENTKFYDEIAEEVSQRDVLLVSSISQQVIVPLRVMFEIPVLAVPAAETGFDKNLLITTFEKVAKSRDGKLYYLVVAGSGPPGVTPIRTFEFDDAFFTNTDHFRGDGLAYLSSRSRLVLPFRWWHARVSWELYDLSQIESVKKL